jgi:predicted  nucleic acid-binding Zn-ribbon protein
MFQCERCGSRYSALHAATMENCPRCMMRDRTAARLAFKAFRLPHGKTERSSPSPDPRAPQQDRAASI